MVEEFDFMLLTGSFNSLISTTMRELMRGRRCNLTSIQRSENVILKMKLAQQQLAQMRGICVQICDLLVLLYISRCHLLPISFVLFSSSSRFHSLLSSISDIWMDDKITLIIGQLKRMKSFFDRKTDDKWTTIHEILLRHDKLLEENNKQQEEEMKKDEMVDEMVDEITNNNESSNLETKEIETEMVETLKTKRKLPNHQEEDQDLSSKRRKKKKAKNEIDDLFKDLF